MPDLTTLSGAGWAGVAMVAIAAIWGIVSWIRGNKPKEKAELEEAKKEYFDALNNGDVEKIMLARKRLEAARKALAIILACICLSGCKTRVLEVPVGKYVSFPVEGETVPALPEGESRWILSSAPTGTKLIFGEELK